MTNCTVHVVEERSLSENAETIMLLHAGASTGEQWRGVQRALGRAHHLVVPDLLGDGRSVGPLPSTPEALLSAEIELVATVAKRARERVHLVGHSYGGLAALRTALAHPEMVRSLVLFEPIVFDLVSQERCPGVFRELDDVRRDCDQAIGARDLERAARRFVDYWDEPDSYLGLPQATRAPVASSMPKVMRAWRAIVESPANYAAVSVPTTIIEAGLSPVPARWMSKRISECIRGARLVHLGGVGHLAPVTHPAVVAKEIGRHVSCALNPHAIRS